MILIALGVLALAMLVALGRQPLMARAPGRLFGMALAIAAACIAAYDAALGGWLGGSILATAALWLATSSRPPSRAPRPPVRNAMSRTDAASMLGVSPTANRSEVEAAYRRLMLRVHPDLGGAPGLATQLNAARAVMLGGER
jgi:DnaJ family protein C protein 19